ncbi:MAG: DsrE family protein [Sulfurovum sp.]|uniref:DsrE family protein n=1 Tax=Sulfurovum sp. TaxID=1969726 RepID=UPI002867FB08|nr:DsrE family protein [Sulfurovum sp.]MCO4845429.1 DsrE family protein [Sulfurovum sp.]
MKLRTLALVAFLPLFCVAEISQISLAPIVEKSVRIQNVVFDCSSANKKYIATRLWLIDMSIKEYVANDTPYNVVITIHSGCTDIVSKNIADNDKTMKNIHKKLETISAHENVSIEACQISVDRFGIDHNELHPFITLVPNSITRVISLQNDGYAFIPFSK